VERVCDTIGIIHEGQLLLVADRDELLERYARNIIFLEVDRDSVVKLDGFVAMVAPLSWVLGVDRDGATLRITVSNLAEAKEALLPMVVAADIVLLRYEWVRPSLEEVFLSISG
jgi:ABC-2 type transport system ATP-binding protein